MHYIIDQDFTKAQLLEAPLHQGEYENCNFNELDLSETDFSQFKFINCSFNDCNLSLSRLSKTAFQDVRFKGCKMVGWRMDQCSDFGLQVGFENCILKNASFYKKKLARTRFENCQLQEADFSECDLSHAEFVNCDLDLAVFMGTNLEKADLRSASRYTIDPELNRLKRAKFSWPALSGLLSKYDIDLSEDDEAF
ncbi:MAG: pentapeptide repeat-containing protein [Sphingobacteriaceae bacterium]|nr:pentapeptide repeat-containing protein [Sphingobacteriaceae bacterium]